MSVTTYEPAEVTTIDPTGGRLVAWAEAASAANQLARALSQTAFVPKEMTNVGNATAAILMGDELGLSPLAALRSIYVVHGTPALYARAMVALALSQGHEVWTEESTDQKVVVCGRRRGTDHVERSEWTTSRATKAKYTSNAKYATNPQEMLYSKAAAEIARKIAPDVLAGMPYSVEDIELGETPTTTVTRQSAARRTVQRAKAEAPEPDLPGEPESTPEPAEPAEPVPDLLSDAQLKKVNIVLRENGYTDREAALIYVGQIIGREVASTKTLTKGEASAVIDFFEADQTEPPLDDAPTATTEDGAR